VIWGGIVETNFKEPKSAIAVHQEIRFKPHLSAWLPKWHVLLLTIGHFVSVFGANCCQNVFLWHMVRGLINMVVIIFETKN